MDISKIDKNFNKHEVGNFNSTKFIIPSSPFKICGGFFDENYGFIKMPQKTAKSISSGVEFGSKCSAGIRVLFSTNSAFFKLNVSYNYKCSMSHMSFTATAGFSLCEVNNLGEENLVANIYPSKEDGDAFSMKVILQTGKLRDYILYFPLYSQIKSVEIELEENCTVKTFNRYIDKKPILYYGSSITQGACSSRADLCYPARISTLKNIDYYILGFSGNAKAEKEMVDYLANFDCCAFVCDYDHNAPNKEYLQDTHLNIYQTFRSFEKNKNIPIIFISKPDAFFDKHGTERFKVIKQTFDYAKSLGDKNVYLIDGRKIYPKTLRKYCSVDNCHPNDLGFYYITKEVYKIIKNWYL